MSTAIIPYTPPAVIFNQAKRFGNSNQLPPAGLSTPPPKRSRVQGSVAAAVENAREDPRANSSNSPTVYSPYVEEVKNFGKISPGNASTMGTIADLRAGTSWTPGRVPLPSEFGTSTTLPGETAVAIAPRQELPHAVAKGEAGSGSSGGRRRKSKYRKTKHRKHHKSKRYSRKHRKTRRRVHFDRI